MKKYLLPNQGNFYKANLHMHTTISDGKMTVEEVKKAYLEKGYSIVAFTDHELMVPHNDLTDDNFLAITSTEIIIDEVRDGDWACKKTYHLNFYSKDKNKNVFSTFNKDIIWFKDSDKYINEEQSKIKYKRTYDVEEVNKIIKMANEENCLVSYNHPVWSNQNYSDYIDLKGVWGVEWLNGGCVRAGYFDTIQPIVDLLSKGERVFPLATDDAHVKEDCFYGFVMIKADNLRYETIYEALQKGDFYSSAGPEIKDLYVEDGVLYIKTSPVRKIYLNTERRYIRAKDSKEELITSAEFDITRQIEFCKKENKNSYIRISVIDENGYEAHSRAYFIEELI